MHVPYFIQWEVADGDLQPTDFSRSDENFYFTLILMVLTRAVPLLVLFTTNVLLLKDINDAVKRRNILATQSPHSAQVKFQ